MRINCVVRTNFNPGCASLLRSLIERFINKIGVSWPAGSESNMRNMTAGEKRFNLSAIFIHQTSLHA